MHESELAEHASVLIHKACLSEDIRQEGLVLHSDNGGSMKEATELYLEEFPVEIMSKPLITTFETVIGA